MDGPGRPTEKREEFESIGDEMIAPGRPQCIYARRGVTRESLRAGNFESIGDEGAKRERDEIQESRAWLDRAGLDWTLAGSGSVGPGRTGAATVQI